MDDILRLLLDFVGNVNSRFERLEQHLGITEAPDEEPDTEEPILTPEWLAFAEKLLDAMPPEHITLREAAKRAHLPVRGFAMAVPAPWGSFLEGLADVLEYFGHPGLDNPDTPVFAVKKWVQEWVDALKKEAEEPGVHGKVTNGEAFDSLGDALKLPAYHLRKAFLNNPAIGLAVASESTTMERIGIAMGEVPGAGEKIPRGPGSDDGGWSDPTG